MARIDKLFEEMKNKGASDLHLSAEFPPLFRLAGELVPLKMQPLKNEALESILFEIMRPDQIQTLKTELELDFAYSVEGVARFRANVYYDSRGIAAAFRIIPTEILSIDQMNLPPVVKKIASIEKGLVLVTGATGSGKSTTLAAMIDYINETREGHIIAIEDPIEFVHQPKKCLVTQREIHHDARNFASALRAACREDPDVILVGELRDLETIGLAMTAAELGVLVFGTLHTNSAAKSIDRIIDAFPVEGQSQVRAMLSDSLKGVIAQQLIRKKDGKGRVAAIEVLVGNSALSNLIREGKTTLIASLIQTGSADGMISMDQALLDLYQKGKIERDEALIRMNDKKALENLG